VFEKYWSQGPQEKLSKLWDIETCRFAAYGGHLEVLKWLRAKGCPWGTSTSRWAVLAPTERGRAGSTDQRMRRRRENLSATVPDGPLSSENDDRDDHDSRGHRSRVFAFFLGLYRVYVFDAFRGVLDLFRDEQQRNAMVDFFGLFVDHFAVKGRSVRQDVLGILMMAAYSPQEQVRGSRTDENLRSAEEEEWVVKCALRAMKFSAAAYGWSILNHVASIFDWHFMPTAQPEWRGIPTPRSARTQTRSDSHATEPPGLSERDEAEARKEEEQMQANLRGETSVLSIVDGISPEDILYSNFTSSDRTFGKLPNHYLAVDHENGALVLAFRGTFSLSEAITDVNCAPMPFRIGDREGFAHMAMAHGAKVAMTVLEEVVLEAYAVYPDHRIWIVGHSLGAGVASLFAVLLKEKHPGLPIESWVFGCPGVLSLNLARMVPAYFDELSRKSTEADKLNKFDPPLRFMQAFCAGEDNVPRLSHGSILDLTSMADTLWQFFNSKSDGLSSAVLYSFRRRSSTRRWILDALVVAAIGTFIGVFGYAAKFFFYLDVTRGNIEYDLSNIMDQQLSRADRLRSSFSEDIQESRDKRVEVAAKKFLMAAHHDKLYPPATVYQIQFGGSKFYDLQVSKPEYFGWLLFSVGMITHHLPRSYLFSLASIRESNRVKRRWAKVRRKVRRKSRLWLWIQTIESIGQGP